MLVFFAQASWAADGYSTSYKLVSGESHVSGDQVTVMGDTDNGTAAVAALTFGFEGEADYNAATSNGSVSSYTAFTSGNGVNGKADGSQGTCYIITPVYDGVMTVAVVLNANKAFYILEDGIALENYNGITVTTKYYGTYSFNVKAGSTYKVTAAGTKLGFYGFEYDYASSDDTPIQLYKLTTSVKPTVAGYTNYSSPQQLKAGANITVRSYANNSNYKFKHWTANDEVVSEVNSFAYTMPTEDVELVAIYEYDPANPADPQATNDKHALTLISEPKTAGSFNITSGNKYEGGVSVTIRAYENNGFVFDRWMSADTLLSETSSFRFTMPDRDVELKAIYHFDPTNPANPDTAEIKYNVILDTKPANAGTFSWNKETQVVANRSCDIYAYPNNGYVFREWQKDGQTVSTDRRYRFQMPAEHIKLVAVYDYNPTNPENPNKNYWNPETGEVIVDDFTSGSLSSAISSTIGGSSNRDKVQMITVAGPISQYDWGVANNYSNCTYLDMSRTFGLTYVPSYNFSGNTTLTTVALPSGIERIEYYAFQNCSNLSAISCYALTPPTIGNRAFEGIGDSIVYVPADAMALYQEAEGWKNFTILPLSNQVSALEVNMPAGTDPAVYKDMYIELINTKSGQKLRYVITNRTTYTFNSLIHRTSYNVYLKNALGDVLGEIDGIEIVDHDVSVTFESLMIPRDLTLKVMTPDGQDVTSQTSITWMDKKGTYLTKDKTLTGQMEGAKVKYRITLPQTLGMQYLIPEDGLYTVEEVNNITYTLTVIPQIAITGKVTNLKTGNALNGATVAISQKLNGLYSKTFTAKTNAKGEWQQTVFVAPTDITASLTDFVSKSQTLETLTTETAEIPTFELKDINGTAITLNLTYTPVDGETQSYYSDYANVAYSVYNESTKQRITEINVQYPQIILMESLPEGTELTITATSKNQNFVAVSGNAIVNDKDAATVTLPIVQLGGINAKFNQTQNQSVVGILYNANNRLLKKYDYNGATLTINELTDGEYTLVTMANSQFFNSVATLSQLLESGLREGVDYLKNSVTVCSGTMAQVNNQLIPFLDETKLYYTSNATSISVNKSQITTGNYLTITSHIDFKSAYAKQVSDVKLIIDLPEECVFVDNSVMRGAQTTTYTYANNQVVVPLDYYGERVRFCFIPTMGGEFTATGSVQFKLNGKTITQPIGSVSYIVQNLSMSVPPMTADKSISINGVASGRSNVYIYDNNVLIGQTIAYANGTWNIKCDLNDPYNLSYHNINAKVVTTKGLELTSDTKKCLYDSCFVQISNVHMLYNGNDLVFDFLNPSVSSVYYSFVPSHPEFTFTVNFTDNDTTKVTNVVLYVKTSKNLWNPLECRYDNKHKCWIANERFSSSNLPINVSIDYDVLSYGPVSRQSLTNAEFDYLGLANRQEAIESEYSDFLTLFESGNLSDDNFESLYDELVSIIPSGKDSHIEGLDLNALLALAQQRLNISDDYINDSINEAFSSLTQFNKFDLQEYGIDGTLEIRSTDGIDIGQLLNRGFKKIAVDDNTEMYQLVTELSYEIVDFKKQTYSILLFNSDGASSRKLATSNGGIQSLINRVYQFNEKFSQLSGLIGHINEAIGLIPSFFDNKISKIALAIEENRSAYKALQYFEGMAPTLEENLEISEQIKKLKAENIKLGKERAKLLANQEAVMKAIEKVTVVIGAFLDAYSMGSNASAYINLWYEVPFCACDVSKTEQLQGDILNAGLRCVGKDLANIIGDLVTVHMIFGATTAAPVTGGTSLILGVAGISLSVVKGLVNHWADKEFEKERAMFSNRISKLAKDTSCNNCPDPEPEPSNPSDSPKPNDPKPKGDGGNHKSGSPDGKPSVDPSGYVYEAVSSNRVQGVTATAYYKETVEDMYGDLHENIVKWDAEEYAQENPLFTDENGMYQWDVPQGLWQVKFEKEGYQTTYSEWLPVPPPQLDVNIPMTQMLQPSVTSGKAFSGGVEFEFDKYMDPSTLTTDNIIVTRNGNVVAGEIKLLNEEVAYEGLEQTYASKLRFEVAEGDELLSTDAIQLTVRKTVKSYAGVQMESDYVQAFDVELVVRSVAVDELINVAYGGTRTITVAALPSEAGKGKKINVQSLSTMIATVNATELTLDENGQAELVVTGELPGSTVMNFKMHDSDVTSQMTVNVKEATLLTAVTPRASRISGTEVYRGTKIQLTSETENAVIKYTLDGTCPCDENNPNVLTYNADEPIVIADDNVTIKAIATGTDLTDSEVAEFSYSLKNTTLGYQMPTGWTWMSHNMETAVPIADFVAETNAERILSQTSETVKDPQWGFFGNLTELQPIIGYKVKVSSASNKILQGVEFNAVENAVGIQAGWNWIGYPLNQVMTIGEALAYFQPSQGDYIVGQDGFAEYDGEQWQGTLEGLKPGQGYLFKSATATDIHFNTNYVSNAVNHVAKRNWLINSPWAFDKYAYSNAMPVTAELYHGGTKASDGEYVVAAFVGDECRGVGQWKEGRLMMNVYGNDAETVHFVAANTNSDRYYEIVEKVSVKADNEGSWFMPMMMTIGNETTDIVKAQNDELTIRTMMSGDCLIINLGGKYIDKLMITNAAGVTVLSLNNLGTGGTITTGQLRTGVYIITVQAEGKTYYKKIIKANK